MPKHAEAPLSHTDRRREVALILARGVLRWHHHAQSADLPNFQKSPPDPKKCLELSGETPLSVGTRGFTPRSDGDEA